MVQDIIDRVRVSLGFSSPVAVNVFLTFVVLVLAALLRWLVSRAVHRRVSDLSRRYVMLKTLGYAIGLVAVLAIFRLWLGGVSGVVAYLGILSAGLAIALQDLLTDLAGWLFVIMRRPFVVGDRIQIREHAGDVIDVRLFQFTIVEVGNWVHADQSTGRIIHIPNGWILKHPLANYTQGFNFIWNEIPVTVTFESNWEKAKSLLQGIAMRHSAIPDEEAAREIRKAARQFMIFFQHLTPAVWTSVVDNGITLTIRYLCPPRQRRGSAERIWEEILRAFAAEDDIDFAYPTTRFFDNPVEGKRGARAASSATPAGAGDPP